MSKKKAFSGSTMTLKDFHGGSIPSDLPLPSAPGVISKTVERSVHDRQSTGTGWGSSLNRGYSTADHRGRQGSTNNNTPRGLDDKVSYLPNSANIGRNFDEDERKPLDSLSRRSLNEDDYQDQTYEERRSRYDRVGDRHLVGRSETKVESAASIVQGSKRQNQYSADLGTPANQDRGSNPYSHQQTSYGHQFASSLPHQQKQSGILSSTALNPVRSGSSTTAQQHGGNRVGGPASASAAPNAWIARREMDSSRVEPIVNDRSEASPWCPQSVASRFAQASAVEKVFSGRWQSRLSSGLEPQHERFGQSQNVNPLNNGAKVGLNAGNFGHGFRQTDVDGGQARNPVNADQNNHNQKEKSGFIEYGENSYGEIGKSFSLDAGNTDNSIAYLEDAKDLSSEPGRNIAVEASFGNRDDSGSSFRETGRGNYGEAGQGRPPLNAEFRGYGDAGWNKIDNHTDLDENAMTIFGKTAPRQTASVLGVPEGDKGNKHLEESGLSIDIRRGQGHQVESSCSVRNEGTRSAYNQERAREAWTSGNSRGSLPLEGARSILYSEAKEEAKAAYVSDYESSGVKLASENLRAASPASSQKSLLTDHARSDISVRPKLKLLPRTVPIETASSTSVWEHAENSHSGLPSKAHEYHCTTSSLLVEAAGEGAGSNPTQSMKVSVTADIEEEERPIERPKLNLKPRSLPVEQLEASMEKERKSLFGGARPRELVLKERGVDDMVITGLDPVPAVNRGSKLISKDTDQLDDKKVEGKVESGSSVSNLRQVERVENVLIDGQVSNKLVERGDVIRSELRDPDKKDCWTDMEKQELQRSSRRNENWRIPYNKDNDKQERRQELDKHDSWRRSADSPVSNSGQQRGPSSPLLQPPIHVPVKYGYGRTASAVELAESFSRSVSIAGNGERFSGQRSSLPNRPSEGLGGSSNDISGRKAVPFSRLTDSSVAREFYSGSVQRQINGY